MCFVKHGLVRVLERTRVSHHLNQREYYPRRARLVAYFHLRMCAYGKFGAARVTTFSGRSSPRARWCCEERKRKRRAHQTQRMMPARTLLTPTRALAARTLRRGAKTPSSTPSYYSLQRRSYATEVQSTVVRYKQHGRPLDVLKYVLLFLSLYAIHHSYSSYFLV